MYAAVEGSLLSFENRGSWLPSRENSKESGLPAKDSGAVYAVFKIRLFQDYR